MGSRVLALASLTVWALMGAIGCGNETASTEQSASTDPVATTIGHHKLRFTVPRGWQHLQQGATQSLRRSGALLEFTDLGTFSWSGVKRQIKEAQRLTASGDTVAAQALLKQLPYLQALFLNADSWHDVRPLWETLTHRQGTTPLPKVADSYAKLLRHLAYQPDVDFQAVTSKLLQLKNPHGQREEASRRVFDVDGRPAIEVTTWDKLSHTMHRSYLFVLNGDNILQLRVTLGTQDTYAPAFNEIVSSLRFG